MCGLWFWLAPRPQDRLDDLIAELRAQGEPVTLAEAVPPLPPEDMNGAAQLEETMRTWRLGAVADLETPDLCQRWTLHETDPGWPPLTPEEIVELRLFVADLAPYFESVDAALAKPHLARPVVTSESAEAWIARSDGIPELDDLRMLLSARAVSAATSAERVNALGAVFALGARHRGHGRQGESQNVRTFAWACHQLRHELETAQIEPSAAWIRFDGDLRPSWLRRLPDTIRAHRGLVLDVLPYMIDGSYDRALIASNPWRSPPSVWKQMERRLERTFNKGHCLPLTPDEHIAELRGSRLLLESNWSLSWHRDQCEGGALRRNGFAGMFLRHAEDLERADMLAGLGRLALAACIHRETTGAWPSSPDELALLFPDGAPLDPHTGESFIMERDGETLILRADPSERWIEQYANGLDLGHVWRLPPR